jgi:hypothetical protein
MPAAPPKLGRAPIPAPPPKLGCAAIPAPPPPIWGAPTPPTPFNCAAGPANAAAPSSKAAPQPLVPIFMRSLLGRRSERIALTIEGSETILAGQGEVHPAVPCAGLRPQTTGEGEGALQPDRRTIPNLIQNFLAGFIKGRLEVELPSGKLMRFGEPNVTAPRIALRDPKAQWTGRLHTRAFRNPAAYRTRRTHGARYRGLAPALR